MSLSLGTFGIYVLTSKHNSLWVKWCYKYLIKNKCIDLKNSSYMLLDMEEALES